ncbi:amidohydrolase family protein [Paracoccus caeni]|uniref:Amidohydrolase family protein n=1 Tax=Paracoccus caeni TaxID=657651 RepID=A0A934SH70_9RHOB|nr:amidohydrolase family protein [Paracoccus caeni]MBK4217553.1 amidohydrolase family protein [Paracoccus caeni]
MNTMSGQINYIGRRRTTLELPVLFSDGTPGKGEGRTYQLAPDGVVTAGADLEVVDFARNFATPGLVDLQVNGFAGCDFNQPGVTRIDFDSALIAMAKTGVTASLPTVITGTPEHMVRTLESLDRACELSRLGPLMVPGYHIEGPFLSPDEGYRGAHDAGCMTSASMRLIDRLQEAAGRPILLVTVAPEVPGVIEMIGELRERGIRVAIGHSAATPDQLDAAIDAGATLSTHLGNGLPQELHKLDNPIFWQLAQDRLSAMFIADGIHVPPIALKTMLRAKGKCRSILVTDAVSAAGAQMKPGVYPFGSMKVERASDGSVRIPGSRYLAGSSAEMDRMIRSIMRWYGIDFRTVLRFAQLNPSRVLSPRWAPPKTGDKASLVEWKMTDAGPKVVRTHIGQHMIE